MQNYAIRIEHRATKADVGRWETVTTYTSTFATEDGEGEAVVEVQVGEASGAWFVRTRDDAGGSDEADDTAYLKRVEAVGAAEAMGAR